MRVLYLPGTVEPVPVDRFQFPARAIPVRQGASLVQEPEDWTPEHSVRLHSSHKILLLQEELHHNSGIPVIIQSLPHRFHRISNSVEEGCCSSGNGKSLEGQKDCSS